MLTAREPHKSIPQIDYGISSPDLLFSFSGTLELAQFAAGRAPRLGHDAEKCSFNFGPDGLMRRHDYTVEVLGGATGANYSTDYKEFQGIKMPTTRRVYAYDENGQKIPDPLLVSIDIETIVFS